jgi:hypothetical protein
MLKPCPEYWTLCPVPVRRKLSFQAKYHSENLSALLHIWKEKKRALIDTPFISISKNWLHPSPHNPSKAKYAKRFYLLHSEKKDEDREGKEIAILAALADECGYTYRGQKKYI